MSDDVPPAKLLCAHAVPRQDLTGKLQLVVEVRSGVDGSLVCWGGPYTSYEAQEAIELFTETGFKEP